MIEADKLLIIRLNARIASQREQLSHKEFVIKELRAELRRLKQGEVLQ